MTKNTDAVKDWYIYYIFKSLHGQKKNPTYKQPPLTVKTVRNKLREIAAYIT